jgi:hypothetical protein
MAAGRVLPSQKEYLFGAPVSGRHLSGSSRYMKSDARLLRTADGLVLLIGLRDLIEGGARAPRQRSRSGKVMAIPSLRYLGKLSGHRAHAYASCRCRNFTYNTGTIN